MGLTGIRKRRKLLGLCGIFKICEIFKFAIGVKDITFIHFLEIRTFVLLG